MKPLRSLLPVAIFALASTMVAQQQSASGWQEVGPWGGDARSIAYSPSNPSHLLLGTTNSWIYESDNGTDWRRLSKVANSDSLVIDNLVYDEANPKRLMVGAWQLDRPAGGIYVSSDDGRTWRTVPDMDGQSVRALAQAPSNPQVFVAGTLKGVYRSEDGGRHWSLISPPGSTELHEVESVAIDPVNPQIIYAGTWHLPWKTQDGGKNWSNIKQGLIVDSDVFSIIIDPHAPNVVYTSACSGIYKSTDAGMQFHKIQGIPTTARRTRVLKQDPSNPNVVYAGTTEGLYRTEDAGTRWSLMTPKDIIINDVYVDPKNSQHVILATDRSGVLVSNDGAHGFVAGNQGFSERQVSSIVSDPQSSQTVYVGVLNDKRFGGAFVSRDAGETWHQLEQGLDGNDVFSLAMSPGGALVAGTNHGLFRLHGDSFENVGNRLRERSRKVVHYRKKHRYVTTETTWIPDGKIEDAVRGVAFANGTWYAATAQGMYASTTDGVSWKGGPVDKEEAFTGVAASGSEAISIGPRSLYVSTDQGRTWQSVGLPSGWTRARYVAADPNGGLWAGGRLGVAYSGDQGRTWQAFGVPTNDISGLEYDPGLKRLVVSSYSIPLVYEVDPVAKNWTWWNPGWRIHSVESAGDNLLAATLLHGVILHKGNPSQAGSGH